MSLNELGKKLGAKIILGNSVTSHYQTLIGLRFVNGKNSNHGHIYSWAFCFHEFFVFFCRYFLLKFNFSLHQINTIVKHTPKKTNKKQIVRN